jgi:hypothetical protein
MRQEQKARLNGGLSRLSCDANGFAFHLFASPSRRKLAACKADVAQGAFIELGDFRKRGAPAKVVLDHPDK